MVKMFQDVRTVFESLTTMPMSSVTDCYDSNGDLNSGVASSTWPVGVIKNCGSAVANTTWSKTLADGAPVNDMKSAASYSGSTNPGGIFKYGVDMDFYGCVYHDPNWRTSGQADQVLPSSDSRCTTAPTP
uniref:Uncharacterized protein n=1 Tax=Hanusia phi TaxID=3032 RepID=A0A7S0HY65_9CRYP